MNIIDRFNAFKSEWTGKRIDFDHVFLFQCVDLILQYVYEVFGIKGEYGNAIDYWTKPSAVLFPTFQKVQTTDVKVGDIVVIVGLAGNPFGHIGIATGNETATEVEILEQNGQTGNGSGLGGDAIRTRFVVKSRIAGILRPTNVTYGEPAPAPASGSTEGFAVGDTVTVTNPVDVHGTHLATSGEYTITEIDNGSIVIGRGGAIIARMVGSNLAKVAPAPAPAPQLPPKPANTEYTKLAGTLSLVVNKNPTNVWHLDFVNDAHAVSAGQLAQGTSFTAFGKAQRTDGDRPCYYMTEADFGNADTTGIPNSNVGINTVDLSPAPAPVVEAPAVPELAQGDGAEVKVPVTVKTWQDSFKPEYGVFKATKDTVIKDLTGVLPDTLLGHDVIVKVGGWVTKDGVEYAITVKSHNLGHWYGIPKSILVQAPNTSGSKVIDAITHPAQTAHAVADDIDKIAAEMSKDPEYAKFKSTLTPRGKLVADIAEAEDKVAGVFSKVNLFKRKYK